MFVVSMPSTMNLFSEPLAPSTWMPPATLHCWCRAPVATTLVKSRPFGIRSMVLS